MKTPFLNRKGFTLIELLVVIAILATLGGISVPVYMSITEGAKKTAAHTVCTQICSGVENFYEDCNRLPCKQEEAEAFIGDKDAIYLTTKAGNDAGMIEILTNNESSDDQKINERSKAYLDAQEQDNPIDGLYIEGDKGMSYYDPWGRPYYVVLTDTPDEGIADPFAAKKNIKNKHCIVYSTGPDGEGIAPAHSGSPKKKGKKAAKPSEEEAEAIEDNVYSWKKAK